MKRPPCSALSFLSQTQVSRYGISVDNRSFTLHGKMCVAVKDEKNRHVPIFVTSNYLII